MCLQYPVQLSLTWSGEVNLPDNGVSLHLGVGVRGFDEFYDLCGCEIVGWVSKKSGCLWFPAKMMSIDLFECT